MARVWSIVWLLLLAAALAPAAPALKDRPAKEGPIVGEWFRVGHTQAGAPVSVEGEQHRQVFTPEGVWQYSYKGNADGSTGKSFVTDAQQRPATIDIYLAAGGQPNWRGIYKVEGDTLTLCLVTGNVERPKTFESSADKPTTIWVFTRVKAKD